MELIHSVPASHCILFSILLQCFLANKFSTSYSQMGHEGTRPPLNHFAPLLTITGGNDSVAMSYVTQIVQCYHFVH